MKVALFPIGMESSSGKQYGPVLEDNRFHYIPIPELSAEKKDDREFIQKTNLLHQIKLNIEHEWLTYEQIEVETWPEHPGLTTLGDFLEDKNI
jgi:hypothetical protein